MQPNSSEATGGGCADSPRQRIGRRDDRLGTGKQDSRFETGDLRDRPGLDNPFVNELRHQRCGTVVAQTTGMDAGGHKVVAKSIHAGNRCHFCRIAVIKLINTLGQGRATGRFNSLDTNILAIRLVSDKGESDTGEVRTTAVTTDHRVGVIAGNLELLFGFKTDDGLMQHDMIKHAAERIASLAGCIRDGCFNGFTDGDTEAARRIRIFFKNFTSGFGL